MRPPRVRLPMGPLLQKSIEHDDVMHVSLCKIDSNEALTEIYAELLRPEGVRPEGNGEGNPRQNRVDRLVRRARERDAD